MRIAVLGGGHGAYAAAADLAEQGHEVRLWRRDAAAFAPVLQSGAIRLKVGAALRGTALVLIPAPATAQADIARAMAPHRRRARRRAHPASRSGYAHYTSDNRM